MIIQFTRLDLSSWLPRKQTLLPLALIIAVGIVLPVPGMAVIAAGFVASLMISAPFLGDEQGGLDTLYGVLPVSRRTIVAGRALSILIYYVIAAVLATAVTVGVALFRGTEIAPEWLLVAHSAAFAFVGLSLSLQLPVLFRIGYSRGRLMAYAPAAVVAGLLWLSQAMGGSEDISNEISSIPVGVVAGVGVLVGTAGIVVGALAAMRSYGTRELR